MRKSLFVTLAVITVLSLVLSACGGGATPVPTTAPEPTKPPATTAPEPTKPPEVKFKACQVTDTGGIDDKSFNATAWKGVQDAMKEYGVEGKYLESQQQTDYDKNITQFLQEKCDIIVTIGFLLADATKKYAEQNPDVPFAIVDNAYDPVIPNVSGLTFQTDEAAFLAGYVAAGMSKSGKVGTWGGIAIPPVTIFMDGFYAGVSYYNQKNGTTVEVLGWDPVKKEGVFINNFESAEDGKKASESLADEGADILLPVAGPAGLGAAAVAKERSLMVIGVDADWFNTAPEYQDYELTSILKNMDVTVKQAIKNVMDKSFKGGVIVGTLANGGVGIAPFHKFEDKVPAQIKTDLESIKKDISAGTIKVSDYLVAGGGIKAPAGFKACQVTDTGGIDDKSFNATAWKGVQDAMKEYGVEGKYLESQQQTDYDKNITQFLQEKCDIIVTIGFLLADATKKYAEQNPDVPFAIVDNAYDPVIPNVSGLTFQTDEAAFLAGYVAAGMSKSGKVGTWGGIAIPPVTIFMDGFLAGVNYYNQKNGTKVEVLGWDGKEGVFINNFESAEDGKKASESLADEGADILLPVAGPAGLGAAAVAKERSLMVIGVDADWFNTAPEYQDYELTSILKNMDVLVKQAIQRVISDSFEGGVIVGTLSNGGVGIAPFHKFEDKVPAQIKDDLKAISADIASGKIKVADYLK